MNDYLEFYVTALQRAGVTVLRGVFSETFWALLEVKYGEHHGYIQYEESTPYSYPFGKPIQKKGCRHLHLPKCFGGRPKIYEEVAQEMLWDYEWVYCNMCRKYTTDFYQCTEHPGYANDCDICEYVNIITPDHLHFGDDDDFDSDEEIVWTRFNDPNDSFDVCKECYEKGLHVFHQCNSWEHHNNVKKLRIIPLDSTHILEHMYSHDPEMNRIENAPYF